MAKPASPAKRASERRRSPPLLVLAWAVLIVGAGAIIAWNRYAADERPPPRPMEPFFIALEPEAPPEPPAKKEDTGAAKLPAMPGSTDVAMVASTPAGETPAAGAPAGTAAPAPVPPVQKPADAPSAARPAAPGAAPPGAGGGPADQQMAAVAPPAPSAQQAPAPPANWQRYAKPFDANDPRPRIAVVIVDLGLSTAATQAAIQNLPGGVTLCFSPYAENLANWIDLARAAGHEAMLGLPMEPTNFPARDPGPRTLLTSLTPQQNLERLDWVLGRVAGYVGVTNNQGSRFTASADALRPVLTTLRDRGLIFLDARTTPRSVAASLATSLGLPRAINDRWLDQQASRAGIDALLADIERVARETGNAVAMGQPYPVTYERLAAWLPTLEGKGFALAPITALLNRQPDS